MKKLILIIVVLVLALMSFLVYRSSDRTYKNDQYGIKFTYPSSYRIQEGDIGGVHSIVLVDKNYLSPENGEGPTSISILIHPNLNGQGLSSWITSDRASNFALSNGKFETGVVAGQSTIFYKSDWLYQNDNAVFVNRGYIVHLSVGYISPDDEIRKDYEAIRANLEVY